jgi:putative ABC transport system permease protein
MTGPNPKLPPGVRRVFRLPWSPAVLECDLDEELKFHFRMRLEALRASGMSEEDAMAEALRRFGDRADLREYCRRLAESRASRDSIGSWFLDWAHDLRLAGRQFRQNLGFTAVAAVTLALGIGANTAIFSVLHHVLLAPLPYPDGNQIVVLMQGYGDGSVRFSPERKVFDAWRAQSQTLLDVAADTVATYAIGASLGADSVFGAAVTPSFFQMTRVAPVIGRAFTDGDAAIGAAPVAIIGYGLWHLKFGGSPDALGSSIAVDGVEHTVIGIARQGVGIPMSSRPPPDLWLPLDLNATSSQVNALARLRPGVTAKAASDELQAIMDRQNEASARHQAHAEALRATDFVSSRESRTIQILFAVVGVLLLIACANVASLVLTRTWSRRHEFAIRRSLGASRARLARQVVAESIALACVGWALAVLVAWSALHGVIALRPITLANLAGVRLNMIVLAWSAGLSVITTLLFSIGPAILTGDRSVSEGLRGGGRTAGRGVAGSRIRRNLVILEIASSLVLVVGAGLLVRSFIALSETPLGYDPQGLVQIGIGFPRGVGTPAQRAAVDGLLQRIRQIPGVTGAALGVLPSVGITVGADLTVEGPNGPQSSGIQVSGTSFIGPDYLKVAGIPLVEGQRLNDGSATTDILISRSLASRLWPGRRAIGARLRVGVQGPWLTIVGITGDVRTPGWSGGRFDYQMYRPIHALPFATNVIVVRADASMATLIPAIRRIITTGNSGAHPVAVMTAARLLAEALSPPRFAVALVGAFAFVALVLAAVGLYGVIAFAVALRTREIGVRVALGAQPRRVVRLVFGDSLRLVGIGVLVGVAGAFASERLLSSMLYGLSPTDPLTFSAAVALLGTISIFASYVPTRRALRIDPAEALRAN